MKSRLRDTIVTLQDITDKERILKAARGKTIIATVDRILTIPTLF